MKTKNYNKILIVLNNLELISKLKELGITNFVYPLRGLTVGIPNTFLVSEINEQGYIYINRILDNEGIDYLKSIKNDILSNANILGIIFDDLGVLEIFKNSNLEKILYLTHFNNNKESIKAYLNYVDNVIISTDITYEEIKEITCSLEDKVSLFTFGLVSAMYSRRLLIDNYAKFYHIEKTNPLVIENTMHKLKIYENEYGTVVYHNNYFDGRRLFDLPCKYYFYLPVFLSNEEVLKVLNDEIDCISTDEGFLEKPTIFKLKGGESK